MSGRTLLGVWAHPDDETFVSSGLLLAARERGDRVVLVTATRGEHGTDDPARWPADRLGAHRARELDVPRVLRTRGVQPADLDVRLVGCLRDGGPGALLSSRRRGRDR